MKRNGSTIFPFAGLSLFLLIAPGVRAQCGTPGQGSEMATGRVFDDLDRDGQRAPGEPGVAGVSVSNGCEVVVTDADGLYRVRLAPGQILFVSQPSGYVVPVDENNLPLFYYRHYPDGTPAEIAGAPVEWLWPVVEPTGGRFPPRSTSPFADSDPRAPVSPLTPLRTPRHRPTWTRTCCARIW